MKKSILSPAAILFLLVMSVCPLRAQDGRNWHFLVKGGFNYTGMSGLRDVENLDLAEYSGFNVGGGMQISLPLAFSIQPEILYYHSGSRMSVDTGLGSVDGRMYNGNIYVPFNIQWGPKLGQFRIFAEISPFFGFALFNRLKYDDPATGTKTIQVLTDDTNFFMGGVGAGIGAEVWKIQFSAKYNWNLNKLFKDADSYLNLQEARMRGLEISVGFMF